MEKIVHRSRSHRGGGVNNSRKQNTPKTPSRYGYIHIADLPLPVPDDLGMEVKTALTEITSLLTNVVQRVERMETELHQRRSSRVSSSSDSMPKHVPLVVRVRIGVEYVIKVYYRAVSTSCV